MDLEAAIRSRRTHKAYGAEPVDRATLEELFELARWAPNHHLTNPWRFRVLGPNTLARLKEAAGPEAAGKLDRAPTLIAVSVTQDGDDPVQDEEDLLAGAVAARDGEVLKHHVRVDDLEDQVGVRSLDRHARPLAADRQQLLGRLAAVQSELGSIGAERARDVRARPVQHDDAARFRTVRAQPRRRAGADHAGGNQAESRRASAVVRESHAPSVRVRGV